MLVSLTPSKCVVIAVLGINDATDVIGHLGEWLFRARDASGGAHLSLLHDALGA